jgi:subtilisin family serine protease
MRFHAAPLLVIGVLCMPAFAVSDAAPASPAIQAGKKAVTSAEQLPRRTYLLPKLPSELLEAPKADLDAVVETLDRDTAGDLATLDVEDRATRTALLLTRVQLAIHRGELARAQELLREVRAQQAGAADKLAMGVAMESILEARIGGGSLDEQRARLRTMLESKWGAMPWSVVGDNLRGAMDAFESMAKEAAVGAVQGSMDPTAKSHGLNVPASVVTAVVSIRTQFEHMLPFKDDMVGVLHRIVDRNLLARADIRSQRLVTLPADAKAKPVVIGIWDNGTDVKLFKAAKSPGIAFDAHMKPATALVRPMGAAEARMASLKQSLKGATDQAAGIDSPDARGLRERVATMKPGEVKQFAEDMQAVGLWGHGTFVAGIATQGNPFARVTVVAMHWSSGAAPLLPDEAHVRRGAAAYKAAVQHFRKAGARVVNMSWRYGPAAYESALAYHNVGKTPEERKRLANRLFAVERRALRQAIAGAPEILFVAGSGKEDNSADFAQYIPAGFELPNLITAGAVDPLGNETSFSTFGKTVVVHANGFEVESVLPGGESMKLSGASMAAPQVANLAAKLFAMKPQLTPVQVKALILEGSERNGRVSVVNPKATLQLAGIAY